MNYVVHAVERERVNYVVHAGESESYVVYAGESEGERELRSALSK